ncbi:glycosyltransferase family 4 protein [Streptococcus uberis]|nr:glycosyltransferase family 4 protein [Streptococcus uberis]MCK1195882.1 glycosyltransferase family 4 protein [Streptococcus uberis]
MNILFCFHNTDRYSGATKSLIDIIDSLKNRNDITPVLLFPKNEGSAVDYFKKENFKICFLEYYELAYQINQPFLIKVLAFPKRLFRYIKMKRTVKYSKIVESNNIDLVYTNTSTIFIGAFFNKYFSIPHLWHLREFRDKDHHTEFFFGNKPFYNYLNNFTDEIIVISNEMYKSIIKKVKKEKVTLIYNDLAPENINPRNNNLPINHRLSCLVAGTIEAGKGQIDAIKAIELVKKKGYDISLDIAGKMEGDYYQELIKYCKKHNLHNIVSFIGFKNDLKSIRHNYHVAIIPSHFEAFGRVTVEAMLSQQIVVGADSAGTSELIKNRENGLLFPVNDYVKLSQLLIELINDETLGKRLIENGYNYGLEFTKNRCTNKIYELIKRYSSDN